jgi:hypothetical protein
MKRVIRTTKIIRCGCYSKYQDLKYGIGKRVGNLLRKRDKTDPDKCRCTVCGTTT